MTSGKLVLVIIPAFNEAAVLETAVRHLLEAGYTVVVVDDGSQDNTCSIQRLPVIYIRHAANLGQGAALQTGMRYALRTNAEVVVHFDADGQHDWRQIETLIAPILDGTADIALGSRFLRSQDTARVPWAKRVVLKGGIVISWLLTGVRLSDSHNGLRALSRNALECINLTENGFAHATEILQRIREAHLRYVEIPTSVVYSEYSKKKGQPIWNSMNILIDLLFSRLFR